MVHGRANDAQSTRPPRIRRLGARVPLLIGLIALVLALLPAAGASAKTPKGFFAIAEGTRADEPDLRQMHDIKVKTMRLNLLWRAVEPQKGVYHWPDARVAALARNGISPFFTLYSAPRWAVHSSFLGAAPLKGEAKRAWKTFVKKAVKRYKRGGEFWRTHPDLPQKPVKAWQIWNEPNLPKYFAKAGTSNLRQVPHAPKAYGKFVKTTGKAINKADKRAKVILAGLSGNPKKKKMAPEKFLKKFLKVNKVEKQFDAAALHPYAPKIKKYTKRISQVRKALKKGGAKKKKLWLTEVGWGSANDKYSLNKGLAGQATMLKKSFKVTLKKRKKWKIERLYWFDWRDPAGQAPTVCSFCGSAGLLKHDRSPKPAYKKFKRFTR
jgi:hypothetical protein